MSFALEELADRLRLLFGFHPAITEKKMFGCRCFMLNGNLLVCAEKDGSLLVRVGKSGMEEALCVPGAQMWIMGQKPMTGYIQVTGDLVEDEEALGDWVTRARNFAAPCQQNSIICPETGYFVYRYNPDSTKHFGTLQGFVY